MKLHVIGLPHTATNKSYGQCAYTQKLVKFLKMFPDSIHYGNEGSDGNLVQIFSEKQRKEMFKKLGDEYYKVEWGGPEWRKFNLIVIGEMVKRIEPQDLILTLGGLAQKEIADAFPGNMTVEFGIGYHGIFSKYNVFESYAWMHYIYGENKKEDGEFFNTVIPNYFDPDDFKGTYKKKNYFLFMSRPITRKGVEIVQEIAKAGHKVVVAGAEKMTGKNIVWTGYAGPEKRAKLMAQAKAILCPTLYIEPFGGVVVEAAMCGTPAITTDFGAFTETVVDGVTGFRCHTLGEFLQAAKDVSTLDSKVIKERANKKYSLEAIKPKYQKYFDRLNLLWKKGWYETG